jgi:hypothetical protein
MLDYTTYEQSHANLDELCNQREISDRKNPSPG